MMGEKWVEIILEENERYEVITDSKYSLTGKSLRFNIGSVCITSSLETSDLNESISELINKYKKLIRAELLMSKEAKSIALKYIREKKINRII